MRLQYDWSSNGFFDAAHEGVKCARPGRTARAGSDRGRTPRAEFRFRSFFSILSKSAYNRPLARVLAPRLQINSRYRSIFDLSSAEVTFISPLCARISIQATANSNKWGVKQAGTKRTDAPYCSGAVEDMAQVEEPGKRGCAT